MVVLLGNKLNISIGRQHLLLALVECEALNLKKIVLILFLEKVFWFCKCYKLTYPWPCSGESLSF